MLNEVERKYLKIPCSGSVPFVPVAVHLSWKLEHPGIVVTLNGILFIMSICEMFSVHGIAFIGMCAIDKWTFVSEPGMCFYVVDKTAWIFKVI